MFVHKHQVRLSNIFQLHLLYSFW